jgi:hypothetical protein
MSNLVVFLIAAAEARKNRRFGQIYGVSFHFIRLCSPLSLLEDIHGSVRAMISSEICIPIIV